MSSGIILFGPMGVGDTTLGKEVAKRLAYPHIDLDDYHWRWDTPIPYTVFRSKEERTESILQAISKTTHFVMSGSMWSIRKSLEPFFSMAVFMTASPEICAGRLRTRELARWGDRVLPGGDMYKKKDYLALSEEYNSDIRPQMCRLQHEQWCQELPCPVLRINGEKPIAVNAEIVVKEFLSIHKRTV